MRIVVIDDDDLHVEMIIAMITGYDSSIKTKTDLDKIEEFEPDLLILDLYMPNQSGIYVCKALKANPKTENIPIIMLSGSGNIQDKIESYDTGCIDYIEKPVSSEVLINKIKKYSSIGKIFKAVKAVTEC